MLYLAEVQKKTTFMGGAKAELKLLARQQAENSWSAVPGDETINYDAGSDYNHGQLVLVDLSANRQIQGNVQEAARQLVGILQNFTRMREKFRAQEEEIEGWKQSLVYQSQELTSRELEMEARQEELEHLQSQITEIEALKAQTERETADLIATKDQIAAEKTRLEELKASFTGGLSPDQFQQANFLLDNLDQRVTMAPPEELHALSEQLHQKQQWLSERWSELDQLRGQAQQQEHTWEQQTKDLALAWQTWNQSQAELEQAQADLRNQQQALQALAVAASSLTRQLQLNQQLQQQLSQAISGNTDTGSGDIQALLEMPLDTLAQTTAQLKHDLDKMTAFINDQEEELTALRQEVAQLQNKISQVNEFERLNLLADLEADQHSCQLLNETLEGQRQRLRERQEIWQKHQNVLQRRQDPAYQTQFNLKPILANLEIELYNLQQEQAQVQGRHSELEGKVQQLQADLLHRQAEQDSKRESLSQQELTIRQSRLDVAELWGQVNTQERLLQPVQDWLGSVQHNLTTVKNRLDPSHNGNGQSRQLVTELKNLILSTAAPL